MQTNLGSLLRRCGVDARRLTADGLTYRILESDLPLLAGTRSPTVFDVGANKGQTIDLMLSVFENPRIISFEPSNQLARMLQTRYQPLGIVVEPVAMGSHLSERNFIHYTNSELSSFLELSSNPENPFTDTKEIQRQPITVSTVDHYCSQNGIHSLDILKIDAQGFDLEVLKGAIRMISESKIRVIQVEILFEILYKNQCTAGQLIDWLGERKFMPVAFYETVRSNRSISWATGCFIQPAVSDKKL